MATAVKTTVTELPESRVRVDAEVPPQEMQTSVERAAAHARARPADARLPQGQGAAAGRHPAHRARGRPRRGRARRAGPLVPRRDRRRRHPPRRRARRRPRRPAAAGPAADLHDRDRRAPDGARSASTRASRSARREPAADDEAVEAELDQLRERSARLETVEEAAGQGDFVVIDYVGSIDGEDVRRRRRARPAHRARLGAPRPRLRGAAHRREGRRRAHGRRSPSPTTTAPAELAGKEAQFAVTVKEIKRKELPELDDDFASDAGRLRHARRAARGHRRQAARGRRAARRGRVPRGRARRRRRATRRSRSPRPLVDARARELWERMLHSLCHQGITKDAYLRIVRQDARRTPRGGQARRRAGAAPRGRHRRGHRGRGHRARRGRRPRRAAGDRRARAHDAREAARAAREGRAPRRAARGPRPARRDRPAGRARDADIRRAGPGARQALDAGPPRQRRRALRLWTPRRARLADGRPQAGHGDRPTAQADGRQAVARLRRSRNRPDDRERTRGP